MICKNNIFHNLEKMIPYHQPDEERKYSSTSSLRSDFLSRLAIAQDNRVERA